MKPLEINSFILKEHFSALETADAKAILEHGEKQLKDTIDSSALIIARLTTLVTVTTGFMVGLLGYGLNRGVSQGFEDLLVISALLGVGYLYIPAIIIVRNFLSKSYYILGSQPRDFFVSKIFDENKGNEMKAICCYEILEVQARIASNKQKNDKRWRRFNISLILIVLLPAVLFLFYELIPRIRPSSC